MPRSCRTGAPLVTLESQTPVSEFDIFAFSVSFEWDYTNVLTLLRLAGSSRAPTERTHHDPLVMIGGAVTFVNPEPLALFADVIAAGEGEALIPPLLTAFKGASDRDDLLRRLVARARLLRAVASTTCSTAPTGRSRRSCRRKAPARRRW